MQTYCWYILNPEELFEELYGSCMQYCISLLTYVSHTSGLNLKRK